MNQSISLRPTILDNQVLLAIRQAIQKRSRGQVFPTLADALRFALLAAYACLREDGLFDRVNAAKASLKPTLPDDQLQLPFSGEVC